MSGEVRSQRRAGARRAWLGAACLLVVGGVSAKANAFRLPVNFNQAAAIGGSGGRYFTGSPSDRYTCKVCHAAGGTPKLDVRGLPVDGYVPGATYAIAIDWDDTLAAVASNFEMTDGAGHGLGVFSVAPPEELPPAELCGGRAAVVVAPPERTLAIMPACGAHAATIRWTAPAAVFDSAGHAATPEAWFCGSVLVSNEDGSVEGDGVVDVSQVFGVAGQTRPPATQISGGCSVAAIGLPSSGCGGLAALGWFGCVAWSRGRKTRS